MVGHPGRVELPAQSGVQDAMSAGHIVSLVTQEQAGGPPGRFPYQVDLLFRDIESAVGALAIGTGQKIALPFILLHPVEAAFREMAGQWRK